MAATIRKMLDLSTNHLPHELGFGEYVEGPTNLCGEDGVIAYDLVHGFLMWVPEDPEDSGLFCDPIRPEILAIQIYARSNDCDYVLFDADGPTNPDLPDFTEETT